MEPKAYDWGSSKSSLAMRARTTFRGIGGGPTQPEDPRKKLGEAFLVDLDRSWRRHGGEVLGRLHTERPEIYFQVMVKLVQVWMLSEPNGFDRRRNRKEVLQRLEDIEQMQRLTNGA
jgi:hypothetical protein